MTNIEQWEQLLTSQQIPYQVHIENDPLNEIWLTLYADNESPDSKIRGVLCTGADIEDHSSWLSTLIQFELDGSFKQVLIWD